MASYLEGANNGSRKLAAHRRARLCGRQQRGLRIRLRRRSASCQGNTDSLADDHKNGLPSARARAALLLRGPLYAATNLTHDRGVAGRQQRRRAPVGSLPTWRRARGVRIAPPPSGPPARTAWPTARPARIPACTTACRIPRTAVANFSKLSQMVPASRERRPEGARGYQAGRAKRGPSQCAEADGHRVAPLGENPGHSMQRQARAVLIASLSLGRLGSSAPASGRRYVKTLRMAERQEPGACC